MWRRGILERQREKEREKVREREREGRHSNGSHHVFRFSLAEAKGLSNDI